MLKAFGAILRAALPAAACCLALHNIFDFSIRQSVGISCILCLLIFPIQFLAQFLDFKPYAFRVEFHLPMLFTDLGLIESPAGWSSYREKALADGSDEEKVFRTYALSPWVFATNDENEPYTRKIEIRRRIKYISVPVTSRSNPYSRRFPEIRFEQWKHWFVLKVVVPEDSEQELRVRFPGAEVSTEYSEYDKIGVSVILATFPTKYLQHVLEYYESSNLLWNWKDRQYSKWLGARGWERNKSPEYIRHRYVSVSFDPKLE